MIKLSNQKTKIFNIGAMACKLPVCINETNNDFTFLIITNQIYVNI